MRPALALAIPLLAAAATNVSNRDSSGNAWWAHVQYLADDKLEGRNTGTPGFEAAADYVVEQFARAGLQPGRQSSYSQPVVLNKVTLDESNSALTLLRGAQPTPIKLGDEALITSTASVSGIEAPLVFAGYGLDIPEAAYGDLKDPALKGAIAVYLAGGPSNISAEIRSHHASGPERGAAMKAAGIIASIAIPNPRSMDIPWSRQSANRLLPRMGLADPAFSEPPPMAFSVTWNPSQADDLFVGSGHTIAEILDAADHNRPLPHFALAARLRAEVATTRQKVDSRNIAAVRPGSSRTLRNQYVILSAHLDHLGTGEKIDGDGIFNGAMDNAAGVASLIEIARAMQLSKVKTKRSVLFLALTAEEKGELGSRYFAEYPVMRGRIVADINMDMYLPLFPLRYLEVQGLSESSLGDDIRAVASAVNVEIQADKDPDANRFIRSDQYSFVKKGVPALAFKFGWIPGSPEEKIFRNWYRDRYHAVSDDVNQPVDRAAAAKFNSILLALLERVADAPGVPQWKPGSYFKVFAK